MNSEIQGINEIKRLRGWFLFNPAAPRPRHLAQFLEPILTRRDFDLAPLDAPWVEECLGLKPPAGKTTVLLLLADGRSFHGWAAMVELTRWIWWARPLHILRWAMRGPNADLTFRKGQRTTVGADGHSPKHVTGSYGADNGL